MRSSIRYFLDNDEDGHWYVIPEGARKLWQDFVDSAFGEAPIFAIPIGGHPNLVTFEKALLHGSAIG